MFLFQLPEGLKGPIKLAVAYRRCIVLVVLFAPAHKTLSQFFRPGLMFAHLRPASEALLHCYASLQLPDLLAHML